MIRGKKGVAPMVMAVIGLAIAGVLLGGVSAIKINQIVASLPGWTWAVIIIILLLILFPSKK